MKAMVLGVLLSVSVTRVNSAALPIQRETAMGRAKLTESERDLQRWRWGYQQRADPQYGITPGAYMNAFNQIQASKVRGRLTLSTQPSIVWTSIGPSPLSGGQIVDPVPADAKVSGRVVGIVSDLSNNDHWFIATVGGGIWETTNAGTAWIPRTDDQPSLQMNVLAIAPGNPLVLYGGTGNYGAYASAGIGILRSTNGGLHWSFSSPAAFTNVDYFSFTGMTVSPSNTSVLLCAALDFFGPTISSGIFRSTNGGINWDRRLAGVGTALAANSGDFNKQYAGMRTIYGSTDGSSNGVYRTFDAGITWEQIAGPWGVVANDGNPILLALPPSDTNVIFVCISGQSLWRSANAWAITPTWTELPLPASEPGVDVMGADSTDSTVLYAGGVNLWRLNGTIWTSITGSTHVDQHALGWAGNKLLLGNDGGMWSSINSGNSWSNHNAQLATLQFYRGSVHPTNANSALGGSQDNGSELWVGTNTWKFVYGGDGGGSAFANSQPDSRWTVSAQGLWLMRTTNGWSSADRVDGGIEQENRPFVSLFAKAPTNDDIFITATHQLWKTTNYFSGASVSWFTNGPDMGNAITAMAFAPSDLSGNTYAYGANNGFFAQNALLRFTTNGGNTWLDLDPSHRIPNRTVTGMAFALSNSNVMYLTLSGFNNSSSQGHVFKTTNALSATPVWSDVSPPIDIPHNAVVADGPNGEGVFAATDIGIWRSTDGAGSWVHMGPEVGMPNVLVQDLELNPANGRLLAFTYGRGAFALVNSTNAADLSFTDIKVSGTNVLLSFKTVIGRNYFIQRSDNLSPIVWSTVSSNIPGTGNPLTLTDQGGATGPRRFYRAAALP